jgi:hypothetical protein
MAKTATVAAVPTTYPDGPELTDREDVDALDDDDAYARCGTPCAKRRKQSWVP